MEPWQLEARAQIRDIVARYNAEGDAGRFERVLELFTEDAVLEVVGDRTYTGRDGIRELFTAAARPRSPGSRPTRIWHHTSTLVIDADDESHARGSCYFAVLTEKGLDHWGRYRDAYRGDAGVWRFVSRRVTVDAAMPGGWGERGLAE